MDDPGSVAPDEFEENHIALFSLPLEPPFDHYPQPIGTKRLERHGERIDIRLRHTHAEDPGKVPRHVRHSTLHPAPTMRLDRSRHRLDQPRPVLPNHSNNKRLHRGHSPYP